MYHGTDSNTTTTTTTTTTTNAHAATKPGGDLKARTNKFVGDMKAGVQDLKLHGKADVKQAVRDLKHPVHPQEGLHEQRHL
jgi:hypothetical protein